MTAELISVGTEILMGNILNSNTQYLAQKCALLGLDMYYQVTVGDNYERMLQSVKTALERADILILTGGLGPTEDDLTKEVCADAMGMKLVEDAHTRKQLEAFFKNNIYKEIPESNWKMALVPEGCIVLDNPNGMAPGLILEKDGKAAILLPGPPGELYPLFEGQVMPYLEKRQNSVLVSKMVKVCGIGESQVEDKIKDLIDSQSNPTIATYAKISEVHIRLTARAESKEQAEALIAPVLKEIRERFAEAVYTDEESVSLEMAVAELLKKNHLTMATAESCTGGMISARLVNVPGISDSFMQGMVTYSNEAKMRLLGVKEETLKQHGAVSEETAKEMAEGGCKAAGTDVCVAVTGLAGPDGGSKEKPVGLVYMACCIRGKTQVRRYQFKGNRGKIREQSMLHALNLVRLGILTYEEEINKGE